MPKTPAELFNLLATDLAAYAELAEVKALFSRAKDPFHVVELLGEGPGRFRIILAWLGEDREGAGHRSGIVKHRFTVTVSMGRGLSIMAGKNLTVARGDDLPLLDRVAGVRDRVRSCPFPVDDTEKLMEYAGAEPVAYEGMILDAYQLTFFLRAALTLNEPR